MLDEIIELKKKAEGIKQEIEKRELEAGIIELREELETLEEAIKMSISAAVEQGITREGSIKIMNVGREVRKVRVRDFQEAHPNIFWDVLEVKVTAAEGALIRKYKANGMNDKEAKSYAKEELANYCDLKKVDSYKIIDALEGV